MANELTVINKSDVELVATQVPQAYETSRTSHDACINAAQALLEKIQREGMSDALEAEAALFITKARKTVQKINDLRSPATKLFDQFKKVFTTMENDIDVSKQGSVVFQIQTYRNQYAAKKREEEERRRAEELRRQQAENEKRQFADDCEAEYRRWFSGYLNGALNTLTEIFSGITLATIANAEQKLRSYPTTLMDNWDASAVSSVRRPLLVDQQDQKLIRACVRQTLMEKFPTEYHKEVEDARDNYVRMIPSKKAELEKIAAAEAANAAEAARIRAEMEAKERAEAAAREAERRQKEEAERKAAEVAKAAAHAASLFDQSAVSGQVSFVQKTSVKKKIHLLNPEGIAAIIGKWLTEVGYQMTPDELAKEFKKQITYCEKCANAASPVFIQDESIEYVDEVKAR